MILPRRELVGKPWIDHDDYENSFVKDPRCASGVLLFFDHDEGGLLVGDLNRIGGTIATMLPQPGDTCTLRYPLVRELVDLRPLIAAVSAKRNTRSRVVTDDQIRALREDARATDLRMARACSAALGDRVTDGAGGTLDQEECRERVAAVILSDNYSVGAIEARRTK